MKEIDFERLLTEARFVHLTEEELAAYQDGRLEGIALARVTGHLKICLICDRRLEVLREETAALVGHEASPDEIALVRRLLQENPAPSTIAQQLAAVLVGAVLFRFVALRGARAATPVIEDGQTEDGTLRWRLVEHEEGNLAVRLGSHALALEGLCLRLRVGDWHRDVRLVRVAPDQVGAETVIPRAEHAQFPEGAALRPEFLPEDPGAGPTG